MSSTAAEDNEQRIERGQPDLYVPLRGSGSRASTAFWPGHAMPLGSDAAAAPAIAPHPSVDSTRAVEQQVTRHRLDRPHVDREARQAPRAPPGRSRLPPLGMSSPEDERRSAAGRSRCRPRLLIRRGSTAPRRRLHQPGTRRAGRTEQRRRRRARGASGFSPLVDVTRRYRTQGIAWSGSRPMSSGRCRRRTCRRPVAAELERAENGHFAASRKTTRATIGP